MGADRYGSIGPSTLPTRLLIGVLHTVGAGGPGQYHSACVGWPMVRLHILYKSVSWSVGEVGAAGKTEKTRSLLELEAFSGAGLPFHEQPRRSTGLPVRVEDTWHLVVPEA